MAKFITVLMTWIRMSATNMASFAHGVSVAMDGNINFATPKVALADLDKAATRVELAWSNRMNGPAAKTELEDAEEALDEMLHEQAAYVSDEADGSVAIIESASYSATSNSRKKSVIPSTPTSITISGNTAALQLQTPNIQGATFCWILFLGTPGVVTIAENRIMISGAAAINTIIIPDGHMHESLHNVIPAGTVVTGMVLAQNSAGKSGLSHAVSLTVGG
jgi:hypothetical protein